MKRKPRDVKEQILSGEELKRLIAIGFVMSAVTLALFAYELSITKDLKEARGIGFSVIVISQLFLALSFKNQKEQWLNMKPLENKFLLLSVLLGILLQFAILHISFFESIFDSKPISAFEWVTVFIAAFLVYLFAEFTKRFVRG